jgi:hypothetical protein
VLLIWSQGSGGRPGQRIAAWFGPQKLPGLGVLNATLCSAHAVVPVTLRFEVDGVDDANRPVQAIVDVEYRSDNAPPGAGGEK